ncbi:MAG: hypothetical protein M3443_03155 [Actinomycetota bacterium]|nr:hypothetical protein [Actinomycetota bacterium]
MIRLEENGLRVNVSVTVAECDVRYTVFDEDVEFVLTGANGQEFGLVYTREGLDRVLTEGKTALAELDGKLAEPDEESTQVT